jgi:hypothetical protein
MEIFKMRQAYKSLIFFGRKFIFFYLLGTWNLLWRRKSMSGDFWGRCREIMADPNNTLIPRVISAGKCLDGYLVMHNGLKVKMGEFSYCGEFADIVLTMNKGVHEPQEEFLFSEILKYMPQGAVMLELGSYWAFYSMWFSSSVLGSHCWMIEPDDHCRRCGEENFRLNELSGTFVAGKVGCDGINIDNFLLENKIQTLHLLHVDVQGAEFDMLGTCLTSLVEQRIWYLFISTHSQELHYNCMVLLEQKGYDIVASADFLFGTFSFDGIFVAKLRSAPGPSRIELALRKPNRRLSLNCSMSLLNH